MGPVLFGVVFVALAVAAFVASVRVGMLLGRRLDGHLESAATAKSPSDESLDSPEGNVGE
jgi:hypothetical protein